MAKSKDARKGCKYKLVSKACDIVLPKKKREFQEKKKKEVECTLAYRWKIGHIYSNSELSKNILSHFFESAEVLYRDVKQLNSLVCKNCYSVFATSNHITRFNPKKRVTKRYSKALKKMARSGQVQRKYKKQATRIMRSCTTRNTKCMSCNFTNRGKGTPYSKILKQKQFKPKDSKSLKKLKVKKKNQSTGADLCAFVQKRKTSSNVKQSELTSFLKSL